MPLHRIRLNFAVQNAMQYCLSATLVVIRNKGESHVFFWRKISLKIAWKLAIKIETVSWPCNMCFWYALALAVKNTSLGSASWRISYRQHSSLSKTRTGIAWPRDRFLYFYYDLIKSVPVSVIKPQLATARLQFHASMMSICLSICLSVCLSVCRQNAKKNVIFSKTKQFRAMVSIDDL